LFYICIFGAISLTRLPIVSYAKLNFSRRIWPDDRESKQRYTQPPHDSKNEIIPSLPASGKGETTSYVFAKTLPDPGFRVYPVHLRVVLSLSFLIALFPGAVLLYRYVHHQANQTSTSHPSNEYVEVEMVELVAAGLHLLAWLLGSWLVAVHAKTVVLCGSQFPFLLSFALEDQIYILIIMICIHIGRLSIVRKCHLGIFVSFGAKVLWPRVPTPDSLIPRLFDLFVRIHTISSPFVLSLAVCSISFLIFK